MLVAYLPIVLFPGILSKQFPELNIKVNVALYAFIIFIVQLSPSK